MSHAIGFILNKLFNIDTDVSRLEKVENQYKLSKQKTLFTILLSIVIIAGISVSAYFCYLNYKGTTYTISFIFAVVSTGIIIKGSSIDQPLAKILMFLNLAIIVPVLLSMLLIEVYFSGFSIPNLLVSLIIVCMLYIAYYAIYGILNNLFTLKKRYQMKLILNSGEELLVKLISVTRRGDYIVEIPNNPDYEQAEVLINRYEIQKIVLHNEDVLSNSNVLNASNKNNINTELKERASN